MRKSELWWLVNVIKGDNKMDFKDGFLDVQLNDFINVFREKHKLEYALIYKTKSFLDRAQTVLVGKTVPKQDIFLVASIVELNKLFQSAILLFERGLPESANILVRSILELSFKIIELTQNENFLQEMIQDISSKTLTTIKKIKQNELFDVVPEDILDELLVEYQNFKKHKINTDVGVYNLAERNGLNKEYILYRTYCDYTHQSIKVIDEIVSVTQEGVSVNGDLRLNDFLESISLLISITMISFPWIIQHFLFDEDLKCQFDLLQEEFLNVFKRE